MRKSSHETCNSSSRNAFQQNKHSYFISLFKKKNLIVRALFERRKILFTKIFSKIRIAKERFVSTAQFKKRNSSLKNNIPNDSKEYRVTNTPFEVIHRPSI